MSKQQLEMKDNNNHESPYDNNKSDKTEVEIDHRTAEFYNKKWFDDL